MLRQMGCLIFFWFCAQAATVHAHGGGLDKYGCHNDRKRGGYHCHRGVSAPVSPNRSARPAATSSTVFHERKAQANGSDPQFTDTPEWMNQLGSQPQMLTQQEGNTESGGMIRLLCQGYQRSHGRSTAVTDGNSVLVLLDLKKRALTVDTPHQPLHGPLQVSEQYYLAKSTGAYGHRYAISLDRYTPAVVIAREQGTESITEFSGSCSPASPKF